MLGNAACLLASILLSGVNPAGEPGFLGRLPHGSVELLGVSAYPPTNQSQWWQPDGSAAALGPFRFERAPSKLRNFVADEKAFSFLVRFQDSSVTGPVSPPSENLSVKDSASSSEARPVEDPVAFFGISPSLGSPGVAGYVANPPYYASKGTGQFTPHCGGGRVVDAQGKIVPHHQLYFAGISASAETADLRVGIDMGPWETVIAQAPDRAARRTFSRDGQQFAVIFSKATASSHTTQVKLTRPSALLSHGVTTDWKTLRLANRLVAIARDGKEHAPAWVDDGRAVFHDLPLTSVKEFRFQVRPYHWVEFQSVSLVPGRRTTVTVVPLDDPLKR